MLYNYKNYGIIEDSEKNRKENTKIKEFPCCDCSKGKFPVELTTSIIYPNSILISGTQPPIGMIQKMEWFDTEVRCKKCEKIYEKYLSEEY